MIFQLTDLEKLENIVNILANRGLKHIPRCSNCRGAGFVRGNYGGETYDCECLGYGTTIAIGEEMKRCDSIVDEIVINLRERLK